MKKLILLELAILFLATTFLSDNPPGWYQQTLPVTKVVTDIFFLDSLNGWTCTNWDPQFDTAYIMRTTNAGNNWEIQLRNNLSLSSIQFINNDIGYSAGGDGSGKFLYTTNGGINWTVTTPFGSGINNIQDLYFVNKDTGWICSDDPFGGGVFKTTNGGINWIRQTGVGNFERLFFLNKDTGWVCYNGNQRQLIRTTNGGSNWNVQYNFTPVFVNDVFFMNPSTGIVTGNANYRTTNGGANWTQTNLGGGKISMGNDKVGWAGSNFNKIVKTTNGGVSWGFQNIPIFSILSVSAKDSLRAWGGGGGGIIHTTDGGGPITEIKQSSTELPSDYKLFQNYPNPFNPNTVISFELRITSFITLRVYNSIGKQVQTLVNEKKNAGEYEIKFDAKDLPGGVYFYRIEITNENSNKVLSNTKKMILLK